MPQIVPSLWFDRNADEAVGYYADAFGAAGIAVRERGRMRYPEEGLPEFQQDFAGEVLTVDFDIADQRFVGINAGPEVRPTPAVSFFVNFDPLVFEDARGALDALHARLVAGGAELMPLGEYDFSPHYAWIVDRYGFSWQLMLTNPDGEPRPTIVPCFLFGAAAQNRAGEAIDRWLGVFPDSRIGNRVDCTAEMAAAAGDGSVVEGSVLFCDFQLDGQWFVAMDSSAPQEFTFTEGVSFIVDATDQAEIDRYWAALSRVPEAEMCGWCKDEFGVSWQITPLDFEEHLQTPGAYQRMLGMRKLDLAELKGETASHRAATRRTDRRRIGQNGGVASTSGAAGSAGAPRSSGARGRAIGMGRSR